MALPKYGTSIQCSTALTKARYSLSRGTRLESVSVKAIQCQEQVHDTVDIVWFKYSCVIVTMKNVLYIAI